MNSKLHFQSNGIEIYNDDFLTTDCIEENSEDLIVTSSSYNVDIRYNSCDDKIPYSVYLEFTQKWLKKVYTLLKDDGRFCLNIPLDKKFLLRERIKK
jgi:site-specific DNA-methyltransferase (adenine-specific)|uniref:DNA methylase N-4/N-6 domain-containing protein n=1 Tax=candidate division WOR-3 bacterium TaxID=2052148 RepID=A0A7V3VTW2_UNCW3